jgi:hypothetical protein
MKKTKPFPADELWVTLIPRGNGDESAYLVGAEWASFTSSIPG